MCLSSAAREWRKNQNLICYDVTVLALCPHRGITSKEVHISCYPLCAHSTQHAQLECCSTLLVGLRWHPWGAISVLVAPAGDSPRVHHRHIQVYATSSKYRHEAIPTREGPCQCTESDWNMASHPALLTFKLFQYYNYMPNTKAA